MTTMIAPPMPANDADAPEPDPFPNALPMIDGYDAEPPEPDQMRMPVVCNGIPNNRMIGYLVVARMGDRLTAGWRRYLEEYDPELLVFWHMVCGRNPDGTVCPTGHP